MLNAANAAATAREAQIAATLTAATAQAEQQRRDLGAGFPSGEEQPEV